MAHYFMKRYISFFILISLVINSCGVFPGKDIFSAHAHNDYEHERPLLDALDCHFKSFEADVFSIGDSLFVAHDYEDIRPGRTLRNLYLDPLRDQILKHKGSVYGNGEEVVLFIDIKDDGLRSYQLLHEILQDYSSYLSVFEEGKKAPGSVMVVVSGNRPIEYMLNQTNRYAGFDGRLSDLDSEISPAMMPVVSDNWSNYFTWDGIGDMPLDEKERLESFAAKAKNEGYILRFWGTPNRTTEQRNAVWGELWNAGVGLIGADDSKGLQRFFINHTN